VACVACFTRHLERTKTEAVSSGNHTIPDTARLVLDGISG